MTVTITRGRGLRALAVALLVALVQAMAVATPAQACACGAIEQLDTGQRIDIAGETALVRHDGSTEDILLSFGMTSASESAALILPLPAKAELDLADVDTFERLTTLTKPKVVRTKVLRGLDPPQLGSGGDGAGGAPQEGGVNVLEEQELGPFTTTQLESEDASDLADWLEEHDYRVRDSIVEATQPYLDEGWVIAAIQLTPGEESGFRGDLQPIRATFPSEEMVYPMRLQAEASDEMPLRVYTLTEHRMDLEIGTADPELKFAGSLADTSLPRSSTLAELAADTPYLTRYDTVIAPEQATTDATFTRHADDEPFREEHVIEVDYPWYVRLFVPSEGTFIVWLMLTPVILLVAGGGYLWRRRRRRAGAGSTS